MYEKHTQHSDPVWTTYLIKTLSFVFANLYYPSMINFVIFAFAVTKYKICKKICIYCSQILYVYDQITLNDLTDKIFSKICKYWKYSKYRKIKLRTQATFKVVGLKQLSTSYVLFLSFYRFYMWCLENFQTLPCATYPSTNLCKNEIIMLNNSPNL